MILFILLDDLALAGLFIGAALSSYRVLPLVEQTLHLSHTLSRIAIAVITLALSVPLWVGLVGSARRLGSALASRAIPLSPQGQADLAAAPRGALTLILEILVILLASAPLLAITQPFIPSLTEALGIVVWVALVGVLALAFWRSANNLLGHARSGAVAVIEALAHAAEPPAAPAADAAQESQGLSTLEQLHLMLGGLGSWSMEYLADSDPCVGRTLAQLNLRGLTGATMLAIRRGDQGIAAPGAQEVLRAGDTVVIAGSADSIKSARQLLHSLSPAAAESAYEFFAISAD